MTHNVNTPNLTTSEIRYCRECDKGFILSWKGAGPTNEELYLCPECRPEELEICGCGRPYYRSETVTRECDSCYDLRHDFETTR